MKATEEQILDAICKEPSATVRELGAMVGLSSSSSVQNRLDGLIAKGVIHRDVCRGCGGAVWRFS